MFSADVAASRAPYDYRRGYMLYRSDGPSDDVRSLVFRVLFISLAHTDRCMPCDWSYGQLEVFLV